jgi:hypothetical protein
MTDARLIGVALFLAVGVSGCGGGADGGGLPLPSGPVASTVSFPLKSCLEGARSDHEAEWAKACKTQAEARWVALKNCLEDPNTGGNQFMGEVYCHSLYGGADPSPTCTLPDSVAEDMNRNHDKAKQQCLVEARLS